MVAIKSYEADRFLARLPAHVFLYPVFGTDAGLVSERAHAIIVQAVEDPRDPFQLLRISGDELAADPLRLADEANTIPLFGGRRAIHIEAQGKAFMSALEPVLAAPPQDCTIVIEAGALKKDAALRKICEREKYAAAIECYPDSAKDLAQLIGTTAARSGLSIAPAARVLIESLLGEDRLVTRLELERLMLYAHGDGEIQIEHVEAIMSDAGNRVVDQPVNAAFSGNFAAIESGVGRVISAAGDVNFLLAVALRHAIALHRARLAIETRDGGRTEAPRDFTAFVPPSSGFRHSLDQHLAAWTAERLARAIFIFAEAVGAARREPKLARAIALRALWKVASAARPGRTRHDRGDG